VVALVVLVLQNEPPKRIEAQHINNVEPPKVAVVSTPEVKPAPTPTVVQPVTVQPKPVPQAPVSPNCGSDPYMAYIYQHESGCRTDALNSIGCFGIGQSCPRSKIAHCGTDWSCQNAWFTNYAVTRYGSTLQAYNFWLANHWW